MIKFPHLITRRVIKFWPWFVGMLSVLLYILPWVIKGESSYVRIHDSLDSSLAWHKIMAEHKFWFSPNLSDVGPIFEKGLPRVSYPGELSLIHLPFVLLEPYWAYVANQFILRLLAFSGMYIFLRNILPDEKKLYILITLGVAICYALIPYWAWTGAVATLPFVFYALMRIWGGKLGLAEIFILSIYPFYTSIVLTGMFLVGLFWLLTFVSLILGRQFRFMLIASISITTLHILVDHRLFEYLIMGGFTSHRVDMISNYYSLQEAWSETLRIWKEGDWAITVHSPVIFYTVLIVLLLSIIHHLWKIYAGLFSFNGIKELRWKDRSFILALLATICFAISLFVGFWNWNQIGLLRNFFPLLQQVNITRIAFFLPFIWMVCFALALATIADKTRNIGVVLISGLLISQLVVELKIHEYRAERKATGVTFSQFYSESLFDEIADALPTDRSSYVVGSVGIHPSIAQYNGFRTADAYLPLYPIEYKNKFRKAVSTEFSRNSEVMRYFDEWGSRVYFFSSQMQCPRNGALCLKNSQVSDQHLDFDVSAMLDLGIKYLFSIPVISNADSLGLKIIGTYENNESAWRITVYQLPERSF